MISFSIKDLAYLAGILDGEGCRVLNACGPKQEVA